MIFTNIKSVELYGTDPNQHHDEGFTTLKITLNSGQEFIVNSCTECECMFWRITNALNMPLMDLNKIKDCTDCIYYGDHSDTETCFSCEWNPQTQIDDNHTLIKRCETCTYIEHFKSKEKHLPCTHCILNVNITAIKDYWKP